MRSGIPEFQIALFWKELLRHGPSRGGKEAHEENGKPRY
jgi:hypothetical protein